MQETLRILCTEEHANNPSYLRFYSKKVMHEQRRPKRTRKLALETEIKALE